MPMTMMNQERNETNKKIVKISVSVIRLCYAPPTALNCFSRTFFFAWKVFSKFFRIQKQHAYENYLGCIVLQIRNNAHCIWREPFVSKCVFEYWIICKCFNKVRTCTAVTKMISKARISFVIFEVDRTSNWDHVWVKLMKKRNKLVSISSRMFHNHVVQFNSIDKLLKSQRVR